MGVARQQDSRSIDYFSERGAVLYELDETLSQNEMRQFLL